MRNVMTRASVPLGGISQPGRGTPGPARGTDVLVEEAAGANLLVVGVLTFVFVLAIALLVFAVVSLWPLIADAALPPVR